MMTRTPVPILMADDDPDDRLLTREAFQEAQLANHLYFVEDGEQLLDYLHQRGAYADPATAPRPGVILLDLNMPKKDGREALTEIKNDPALRRIPIIVMTTSEVEQDILRSYDLGANAYIIKPVTFSAFVDVIVGFGRFWFEIVELPPNGTA